MSSVQKAFEENNNACISHPERARTTRIHLMRKHHWEQLLARKSFEGAEYSKLSDKEFDTCPNCGKRLRSQNVLNKHLLVRTRKKPHSCSMCGSKFTKCFNVKRHADRCHRLGIKDP
ncbi:hypothetical protein X801_08377 [Opisthorchis viverrini]|uniref:C2H2-type domain-containing protein n=1 Tax=Opisthorchis viverrini TaxID=6198 RepID=A0A1S8WMY0_OPIVI|nr:hypothetical protein X801_08377 [Opisthorchis viverrini]